MSEKPLGKLKKLRCRLINSIGVVKRSVLSKQSEVSSNNTTSVDEADLTLAAAVTSRRRRRITSSWRLMMRRKVRYADHTASSDPSSQQLQLHWSEARRIFSEPMMPTEEGESCSSEETGDKSSPCTSMTDCRSLSCGAVLNEFPKGIPSSGSCQFASNFAGGMEIAACSLSSDEDENDDVFLQSWEDERGIGLYLNTTFTCSLVFEG